MKHDVIKRHCRQTRLLLDEYSQGELDVVGTNKVEAHLDGCDTCRAEYSLLTTSREALSNYPQIAASADFDLRVLDQILQQQTRSDSLFDRLDAIFARPLYKLMGSAVLSVVLGVLTLVVIVGPHALLSGVSPLSTEAEPATQPLTAANPDEVLEHFYASGRLYPELWREQELLSPTTTIPHTPKGGDSAWKRSKKSLSNAVSDYSFSAPSGSSC